MTSPLTRKDLLSRRKLLEMFRVTPLFIPLKSALFWEENLFGSQKSPKKLIVLYYPNGNPEGSFFPSSIDSITRSPILAPLAEHKELLFLPKGLEFKTSGSHEDGARYTLTGATKKDQPVSIEHFVGSRINKNDAFVSNSLSLGVLVNETSSSDKTVSFTTESNPSIIEDKPSKAFQTIFGTQSASMAESPNKNDSLLSSLEEDVRRLKAKIGTVESQRLDNHLSSLRELSSSLNAKASFSCSSPQLELASSYGEETLNTLSLHMRTILLNALKCGYAPTGLIQYGHPVFNKRMKYDGSSRKIDYSRGSFLSGHHDLSHYSDSTKESFIACQKWFMEEVSALVRDLKQSALMDDTVVFVTTELGDSTLHNFKNVGTFVLSGKNVSLPKNIMKDYAGDSYNKLLQLIVQSFGLSDAIGDRSSGVLST